MARVERGSKEGMAVSAGRIGKWVLAAELYQEPGFRPSAKPGPDVAPLLESRARNESVNEPDRTIAKQLSEL